MTLWCKTSRIERNQNVYLVRGVTCEKKLQKPNELLLKWERVL